MLKKNRKKRSTTTPASLNYVGVAANNYTHINNHTTCTCPKSTKKLIMQHETIDVNSGGGVMIKSLCIHLEQFFTHAFRTILVQRECTGKHSASKAKWKILPCRTWMQQKCLHFPNSLWTYAKYTR